MKIRISVMVSVEDTAGNTFEATEENTHHAGDNPRFAFAEISGAIGSTVANLSGPLLGRFPKPEETAPSEQETDLSRIAKQIRNGARS